MRSLLHLASDQAQTGLHKAQSKLLSQNPASLRLNRSTLQQLARNALALLMPQSSCNKPARFSDRQLGDLQGRQRSSVAAGQARGATITG